MATYSNLVMQELAQLPQRDHATRYISKLVLCFMRYGSLSFKQQKRLSSSVKGIDNDAIRQATYDLLLMFHCNCAC